MLRGALPFARCALILAAGVAAAAELRPRFAAAPAADRLLTWEIAGAPAAWRRQDVGETPRLELRGPDGRRWRRPAFIDGPPAAPGTALLVRHTPRLAGTWSWRLLDPAGAEAAAGAFAVGAPEGPVGPIRAAPANPRLLAFADGTPFIPIGPNLCWADGPDHAQGYEPWLRRLAEHGGTHTRVWMCSWSLGLEGTAPDAWRWERAGQLDRVLAQARRLGLRLTLVLDNHTDVEQGTGCPYGATFAERQERLISPVLDPAYVRRLRYVLARWGADDSVLAWEAMNEADLAQPIRERVIPWLGAVLACLAEHDPDRRLRTWSWSGDDWPRVLAAVPPDLVQIHAYVLEWAGVDAGLRQAGRDGVGQLADALARTAGERPAFIGECGYQGSDADNPGLTGDPGGLLLRQQAWAGWLAGGCGPAMPWWWYNHIEPNRLWPLFRPLADAAARLDWRDAELMPLAPARSGLRVLGWQSPRQALLWPQPAEDTWHAHLVAGRPRPLIAAGTALRLAGLRGGGRFRAGAIDQRGGAVDQRGGAVYQSGRAGRDLGELVADADGRLLLPLIAGEAEWTYWLRQAP